MFERVASLRGKAVTAFVVGVLFSAGVAIAALSSTQASAAPVPRTQVKVNPGQNVLPPEISGLVLTPASVPAEHWAVVEPYTETPNTSHTFTLHVKSE